MRSGALGDGSEVPFASEAARRIVQRPASKAETVARVRLLLNGPAAAKRPPEIE